MREYHDLLRRILDEGVRKEDRTGTGTLSVFGHQTRYDLTNADGSAGPATPDAGFPLITTKKLHLRSIIHEAALVPERGHEREVAQRGRRLDLGRVGGRGRGVGPGLWEAVAGVAQAGRGRSTRSGCCWMGWSTTRTAGGTWCAWNVGQIDEMALPPCHCLFQFAVEQTQDGGPDRLSCQLYQRSADVFLGVPFNIASYALLTMMIAQVCGYRPGAFIHTLGDAHLYLNHLDQARLQLERKPKARPIVRLNPEVRDLFAFRYEDVAVEGYDPHPHIRAAVAV